MASNARDKAERCFALARSTSFAGERDNAIAQGTRIAEGANLSLDLFDIPGRPRKADPKPEARGQRGPDMGGSSYYRPFGFGFDTTGTADDLSEAFRKMAEDIRRETARVQSQSAAMTAMRYLRSQGAIVDIVFAPPRRWRVMVGKITLPPMTDDDLIKIAEDLRLATEARDRKRAYEAGRQSERCARCGSLITVGVRHECPVAPVRCRCGFYDRTAIHPCRGFDL